MLRISFKERVIKIVKDIPRGEVLSYKEVATLAGSPGAARAVGNIMANNFDKGVPCHRVIKSDGSFGKYNALQGESREQLLREEGYIS